MRNNPFFVCAAGNLPMKEIFAKEVGEVERFCVEISKEVSKHLFRVTADNTIWARQQKTLNLSKVYCYKA